MISRSIGANEQGGVQGSLTSLASVAGIVSPPIMAGLFAWFISSRAPIQIPGAAYFFSSILVFGALILAIRSFQKKESPITSASQVREDASP
jgi:MFS transporter, DHA1 family, tetracycline resistance protein